MDIARSVLPCHGNARRERKANDQRTAKRPNGILTLANASERPLCRRKITMRASVRLLFAIAFIGGMNNAALAGSRASLADLWGKAMKSTLHPRFH
jgi:hypothetical protein